MRDLRADQVLSLGSMVTAMGDKELHDIDLTDLGVLAHLGMLTEWSPKKVHSSAVTLPEFSHSSFTAHSCFPDESRDFRCDSETQT